MSLEDSSSAQYQLVSDKPSHGKELQPVDKI